MVKYRTYKNRNRSRNKNRNTRQKRKKLDKRNITRTFKNLECSPKQDKKIDKRLLLRSCYDNETLNTMKQLWNKYNSQKIRTNNPEEIWQFFKDTLSHKCYNELCWLNEYAFSSMNKQVLIKNLFRPMSPRSWKTKPYEWLSSVDIIKVMEQYVKKFDKFVFIGPSPIDFDNKQLYGTCIWEKLCNFNLKSILKNNKTKIGIIFNTDPHDEEGSHWIALFINIDEKFIFYFDSNGDKIPKQVKILVDRIISQGKSLNIDFTFDSNYKMEHQKKDGQCGIYTLYFIIELLKGNKTPKYFKTTRIPDEVMKDYRIKYYNTPDY